MTESLHLPEDRQNIDDVFVLKIDYFDTNPIDFFVALSRFINALHSLDKTLAQSVDSSLEPSVVLENVQDGSLLVAIRNIIESIDDEAIKDLSFQKLVGAFLVRGKYTLLRFLENKERLGSVEELMQIKAELESQSEHIKSDGLIPYRNVNSKDLLYNISELQSSLENFDERDSISYQMPALPESESVEFNRRFRVEPTDIEDFVTAQIIKSTQKMILKIKKPDFLGNSKWEFKHGKSTIEAKMLDIPWLENFQKGSIPFRSGDAISAEVNIEIRYDLNGDVLSDSYTISKVNGLINRKTFTQTELNMDLSTPPDKN